MKKRRMLSFISCAVASAVLMSTAVYAFDTNNLLHGSYTHNQQKDLKFRISQSIQTSLFDRSVYESALNWNNISSNVHVSIIMETPGMPTIADTMGVYDGKGGNPNGENLFNSVFAFGVTQFYDSNGKVIPIKKETFYGKVEYVKILINNSLLINKNNPAEAAAMNFSHEVGHTLMLNHPVGIVYSIMNNGAPEDNYLITTVPSDHDIDYLKYKWGA